MRLIGVLCVKEFIFIGECCDVERVFLLGVVNAIALCDELFVSVRVMVVRMFDSALIVLV